MTTAHAGANAILTCAAVSIGHAVPVRLACEGAQVTAHGRDAGPGETVVREITGEGSICSLRRFGTARQTRGRTSRQHGLTLGIGAGAEVGAVKRRDEERIIAAARAVAAGGTDATGQATRLISTAEPLASVLARLELADEPRLLSITATPLGDVASVNDMLRALPTSTPWFVDTDDRRELHMTVEVRDGQDNWLGDVQFVWCA